MERVIIREERREESIKGGKGRDEENTDKGGKNEREMEREGEEI